MKRLPVRPMLVVLVAASALVLLRFPSGAADTTPELRYVGALPEECATALCALRMIDPISGWLWGRQALWRTRNGGTRWEEVRLPGLGAFTAPIWAAAGTDSALVLARPGGLYGTDDGGADWTMGSPPPVDGVLQDMWAGGRRLWIGGGEYFSSARPVAPNYALRRDDLGRWEVLRPVVFRRDGPGLPWIKQSLPPEDWMVVGLQFWDAQKGIALGDNCLYYTESAGDRWSLGSFHDGDDVLDGCPGGGGPETILLGADLTGWLSADSGSLYQTTDGGANWNLISAPETPHFDDLAFAGKEHGFGVARVSQLYESTDSGRTWRRLTLNFVPRSVQFLTGGAGWVTSDTGLYRIQVR